MWPQLKFQSIIAIWLISKQYSMIATACADPGNQDGELKESQSRLCSWHFFFVRTTFISITFLWLHPNSYCSPPPPPWKGVERSFFGHYGREHMMNSNDVWQWDGILCLLHEDKHAKCISVDSIMPVVNIPPSTCFERGDVGNKTSEHIYADFPIHVKKDSSLYHD